MLRRIPVIFLLGALACALGCTNKKVKNPLADVNSKQPDKVLFDRAMDAMKHNRFDVSRMTLQVLINTYPDSEYIARAKLAVADSWYAEGGGTALAQAEIEYNDFRTFFPNMAEAAEAQLKIANIHYQQMEKPDRDFTHAMRAQDEYRNLILQFPDSKLVPEAKKRLLEVQEVLAEREFRIGHFYFMRQSYPAAIARLQSVTDRYPLYSGVDETLYLLGQAYEQEIATVRAHALRKNGEVETKGEAERARLIQNLTDHAAQAYSKILTRYPVMGRALDAKARLEALHQPVPRPTKAAVAQNKAEEESRRESGTVARLMSTFRKHPDVAGAARTGEPPLADPKMLSASEVVQEATRAMTGAAAPSGGGTVAAEIVKQGAPPPNQAVPRSESITASPDQAPPPVAADPNELKPNVAASADPNELKPNVPAENAQVPAPQQVNELAVEANGGDTNTPATTTAATKESDDSVFSSSKRNKKKGIRKVVPF